MVNTDLVLFIMKVCNKPRKASLRAFHLASSFDHFTVVLNWASLSLSLLTSYATVLCHPVPYLFSHSNILSNSLSLPLSLLPHTGFDGFDWDIEGNDDEDSPFNTFKVGELNTFNTPSLTHPLSPTNYLLPTLSPIPFHPHSVTHPLSLSLSLTHPFSPSLPHTLSLTTSLPPSLSH